jgi:hypothetical protein
VSCVTRESIILLGNERGSIDQQVFDDPLNDTIGKGKVVYGMGIAFAFGVRSGAGNRPVPSPGSQPARPFSRPEPPAECRQSAGLFWRSPGVHR